MKITIIINIDITNIIIIVLLLLLSSILIKKYNI